MLVITPTFTADFDTFFGADAPAAKAAWVAAAQVLTSLFSDNIHINITVDAVAGTDTFGHSHVPFLGISYADLFAKVSADAKTQADQIAIGPGGSMTAADPTNGAGTWWLARTQAKALGFIPDDMSDDGTTIFGAGNPFTFSGAIAAGTFDFQGLVAHEISEVMGRLGLSGGTVKTSDGGKADNSFSLIDNFSYTAPGTKGLRSGPRNHFSIDNGTTLLKLWNDPTADEGDSRDWAPGTNDAFNQVSRLGVADPVSAVDVQLMDVIGYDARKLFQYYTLAGPGSAAPAGAITSVFKGADVMEVWWVAPDGSVQAAYHEGSWQYYTLAGPGSAAPAGAITSVFKGADVMEVWWVAPDGSVQAAYHEGSWQYYTLAGPGSAAPAGAITSVFKGADVMEVWWVAPDGSVQAAYHEGSWQYYTLAGPGSAAPAGAITSVFKGGDVMEVWWVAPDGSVQAAYHEGSWQYYTLAGPGSAAPAGAITSVFKGADVMEVWWVAPDGSVQAAYHEGSWQYYTLAGPGSAAPAGAITSVFKGADVMEVWWVAPDGSVQAAYHEGSWQYYTLAGPGSAAPAGPITSVFKGADVMEVWWVAPDGSVQAAYHEN